MTWQTSELSDKVIPAWVAALKTMEDIVTDSKVEAGPIRYKYASLGRVLDEVRPKLGAQGLAISQHVSDDGVTTVVFHESGQWLQFGPLHITPAGSTPQSVGSAISYGRRYSLLAVTGLATEDDDGRAASVDPKPHDPVAERVDATMKAMTALSDDQKTHLREWADGRSLSGKTLYGDTDWLSEVEAFLDEGLGSSDDDLVEP